MILPERISYLFRIPAGVSRDSPFSRFETNNPLGEIEFAFSRKEPAYYFSPFLQLIPCNWIHSV